MFICCLVYVFIFSFEMIVFLQLLSTTPNDKKLERALFAHANGITERFFGEEVGYRGYVIV